MNYTSHISEEKFSFTWFTRNIIPCTEWVFQTWNVWLPRAYPVLMSQASDILLVGLLSVNQSIFCMQRANLVLGPGQPLDYGLLKLMGRKAIFVLRLLAFSCSAACQSVEMLVQLEVLVVAYCLYISHLTLWKHEMSQVLQLPPRPPNNLWYWCERCDIYCKAFAFSIAFKCKFFNYPLI